MSTVDDFVELFAGRTDVYGSWTGGCVPLADHSHEYIEEVLTNHLYDGPFIGVYPLTDDNTVGWGCVDIDGKDHPSPSPSSTFDSAMPDFTLMWAIAAELQDVLAYKEVTSWLERTPHGIHVWVFAEERVQATVMRQALLVACEVAAYKPKEVNPKQCHVSAEKPYGNYVRLPYYGALAKGELHDRFVVDEDGQYMTVEEFSRTAMGSRTPVRPLEAMSKLYVAPAPHTLSFDCDDSTEDAFVMLEPILPTIVKLMFADKTPFNGDRSGTLVKAAVIMRDEGWQAQAVFTVLRALDRLVLGKFVDRADPDKPLLDIMERYGIA